MQPVTASGHPGPPSSPGEPAITVLRWEDERQVAALLARAFVDDPLVIAICDGPARERQERMRWSFRIAVRGHSLGRQPAWIVAAAGAPLGVVLVTRARLPLAQQSDALFTLRGLCHVGARTAVRGFQAAQVIASHAPPEPFTYLRTLGVDPDHQNQGVGSQLVEQVIRVSPPTLPIYLETAKERNLSFYARHGFEDAGAFDCLGAPVWRLIRPAAANVAALP